MRLEQIFSRIAINHNTLRIFGLKAVHCCDTLTLPPSVISLDAQ